MLHEGYILLFRNRPLLAPELMRDALHVEIPFFTEARAESGELTEVAPTEYRADLVVLLLEGRPVFGIVIEVQLGRDDRKRKTWPNYVTSLGARLECPTALLVVTPDPGIARWAAEPIETGHPGFTLRPLVTGPAAIPPVTDPAEILRDPELAVLSAMAHGDDIASVQVAKALNGAFPGLDADKARLYLDLVVLSLSGAARAAFEALMQTNYEYQSDYARKYFGQGRAEGIETGIEKGIVKGEARAVLQLLKIRGVEVDAEAQVRIESCEDSAQITTWLGRAMTVKSSTELFAAEPKAAKRTPRKR